MRSRRVVFLFFFILLTLLCPERMLGQMESKVDKTTDVLSCALPLAAALVTLKEKDRDGLWQLAFTEGSCIASVYLLKWVVRRERPDGSDRMSFPSSHTAVSFAASTFLARRCGWGYAIPFYLLSCGVAWGRLYAHKHDVWDVTSGALIGAACGYFFARPLSRKGNAFLFPSMGREGDVALTFVATW